MVEGYEKIRVIGKGSFGIATLYTRQKDNKLVVLKETTTSDMDHDEKTSAYDEIKILSALNHPNIIRYFDSIIKQDFFVIIMDYADGGNLAQLINLKKSKNEAFKEKGIFFIVFQISDALSYMHGKKILHRDLKSANIFMTSNGIIKVGDFGISKMMSTKSQAHTVVGTPYYLSPEMCEGKEYDEKSDIWALGCILYEMAALKRPFNAPNLPLLVQKILRCDYDDIPYFYCKDMKVMVELMLQKNTVFRPTAKFIHDIIIPDILEKNGITFDYRQITENSNLSKSKERSVLYEITNNDGDVIVQPKTLPHKKIVDFSISSTHSVVIFEDQSVYAWGSNKYCELGVNTAEIFVEHPVYVKSLEFINITKCVTGKNFTLFLTKYGQLYSCGHGATGCLGHGNVVNVYFPIVIRSLSKTIIKDIICGSRHVIALDTQGKIYVWGSPKFGQYGFDNNGKICSIPIHVKIQEDIQKIFCTDDSTLLLSTQNSIFVSGSNKYQKLGIKNKNMDEIIHNFRKVRRNFGKVLNVSMSKSHTVIVNTDGAVFLLGDNTYGQLGKDNGIFRKFEHFLKLENKILQSTCTDTFTTVFDEKNILWLWGVFESAKYKDKSNEKLGPDDSLKHHQNLSSYQEVEKSNKELQRKERYTESNAILKRSKIGKIKSIMALYSSKENLKTGNYIIMSRIKATENSIFLLVDTTCPAPYKKFSEPYNLNSFSKMSHATTRTYYTSSGTE